LSGNCEQDGLNWAR